VHVLPCVRSVRTVYTCALLILAGKYGQLSLLRVCVRLGRRLEIRRMPLTATITINDATPWWNNSLDLRPHRIRPPPTQTIQRTNENQTKEKVEPARQSHRAAPQYASSTSSSQASAPTLPTTPPPALRTGASAKVRVPPNSLYFDIPSTISHITRSTHTPALRIHTPLHTCGLILCTLHLPTAPAPHCSSQLLDTPRARATRAD
jgi:hypothetical protein